MPISFKAERAMLAVRSRVSQVNPAAKPMALPAIPNATVREMLLRSDRRTGSRPAQAPIAARLRDASADRVKTAERRCLSSCESVLGAVPRDPNESVPDRNEDSFLMLLLSRQ